jgi:16S rRNA (cytidine1402-2'-O)-methyltransferase
LIRKAACEGIPLVPIPGPSAAIAALSISGLPTESFLFYGFLPAKASARKKFLEALKKRLETLIFYESPRRLGAFLRDALEILGNRQVVVTREITKVFEETLRGTIGDVSEKIGEKEVRGEITVILAGNSQEENVDAPSIQDALRDYVLNSGASMKEAIERVAEDLGVAKREVYQESLKLKKENPE